MMNIKISVVIPMYNAKNFIKDTIESVINQTYSEPIEIIVVNDGSDDGCEKIVKEIITNNKTNRIIKLINKSNGGVSSARNKGIKESNGDWIALLDADDVWFPEKLQLQIDEIEKNPKIKFIGTNRNGEIYPFFNKFKNRIYTLNAKQIIVKWYPHTSTALINKEILLKTNLYDERKTRGEDGDLWLKIIQFCNIYILNEDLVYTGGGKRSFGESGLSANMPKMFQGEILALKDAKNRKQINIFECIFFYLWLTFKYYRRILIIKRAK